MKPKSLRSRQIHLDFHTSPDIARIGEAFDPKAWKKTLLEARVDSITCFSKCHHGLSYHPTEVGTMHPHLGFDLLRAQVDACKEAGIRVPVYLSAGVDNTITKLHPEWREIDAEGRYAGWVKSPLEPGFHKLCFNSPYLDYLCRQIEEAASLFPEADGIFLDIIAQGECCCPWCLEAMARDGLDPHNPADRKHAAELALERYFRATTAACKIRDADMPVFHNSGHVRRDRRAWIDYNSHLELESLPTGGWGYDHFPESASYASHSGLDYLGMTGKFHLSWGEFGGFKHPNALRYECAAMNAFGAKCSVGDQLHPDGKLDASTYRLIGEAYAEVEAKEPWCRDSLPVADIAVLSSEAEKGHGPTASDSDTGACRILLEGHHLFSLIDRQTDLFGFKLLVLPDNIGVDDALKSRIDAFLARGGKLLLTGKSGLDSSGVFAWDIGAKYSGESPFAPDFILPAPGLRPEFLTTPSVIYGTSQRIEATAGKSLGQIFDPYFNRTFRHFCSHKHTPYRPEPSGFDAGVRLGNIAYLAHPVFTAYRKTGPVLLKDFALAVIGDLLGEERTVRTNLSSGARITLRRQPSEKRAILHLLYANKQTRGGNAEIPGGTTCPVEVIEDLDPLLDTRISIRLANKIDRVTLEPQGEEIAFEDHAGGQIAFSIPRFACHQMVALRFGI